MRSRLAGSSRFVVVALGGALLADAAPWPLRAQQRPCREEAVTLQTSTGTLAGTLRCPDEAGPWAVALLVPGAGAIDRNGNSATQLERPDTFKQLADGLAARGIASVRYDKRGVGESRGAARSDSALRFATFAHDAAEWVQQLQVDPRFSSVTVVGHGEGALVGMLAARVADADGFVSLAGQGRRGADVMREQLAPRLPIELRADFRRVLGTLSEGRLEEDVPYELTSLLRPSAQAYLISWFRFDPPTEISRLAVPVLIVQGSVDDQSSVRDAQLLNAGQPRADAIVLEGVDHSLRKVSTASLATAARSGGRAAARARDPVCDDVLEGVAAFVSQIRRR
jgi:uncharacterized protein